MNQGADAAELLVRQSLQFAELAVKLTAMGLRNSLAIALAYARQNPKARGKTTLGRLLKEGRELKVFPLPTERTEEFHRLARQYGVLYAAVPGQGSGTAQTDLLFRAEDVAKMNRICELMGLTRPAPSTGSAKNAPTPPPYGQSSRLRGDIEGRTSIKAAVCRIRQAAEAAARTAMAAEPERSTL